MKTRHFAGTHPTLLGFAVLLCAVLVVGCQDSPVSVGPELSDPALTGTADVSTSAKKPGSGGGGGGTGFTVALTGGMITPAAQEFTTFTDRTKGANASIGGTVEPFEAQFNLSATKAYSESAGNTCDFDCDPLNPNLDCNAIRQSLESLLVTNNAILLDAPGLNIGFDKNNALAGTGGECPTFTAFGDVAPNSRVTWRNCKVTYDDGDGDPSNNAATINDADATRTFTLVADSENLVRAFKQVDSNGDGTVGAGDDLVNLYCPLQPGDEVSATIERK